MHKKCLSITQNYVYYLKVIGCEHSRSYYYRYYYYFLMHVFDRTCHEAYALEKTREVTGAHIC